MIKLKIGDKQGRLTIEKYIGHSDDKRYRIFECRCECGNIAIMSSFRLLRPHDDHKHCGCQKQDRHHSGKFTDLTGRKIGRLTVIRFFGYSQRKCRLWECRCDCGVVKIFNTNILKHEIVKSCGCLHIDTILKEIIIGTKFGFYTVTGQIKTPRGIKWICRCECGTERIFNGTDLRLKVSKHKKCSCNRSHDLSHGMAAFNELFYGYKHAARSRGHEYLLSKDETFNLVSSNCYYCNEPPSQIRFQKTNRGSFIYNGIDRVDNLKGYSVDNCVACCKICNYAKRNLKIDDFKNWVTRIYNHLILKSVVLDLE